MNLETLRNSFNFLSILSFVTRFFIDDILSEKNMCIEVKSDAILKFLKMVSLPNFSYNDFLINLILLHPVPPHLSKGPLNFLKEIRCVFLGIEGSHGRGQLKIGSGGNVYISIPSIMSESYPFVISLKSYLKIVLMILIMIYNLSLMILEIEYLSFRS